jgi:AraC-like DNA-binding protein
MNGKIFTGEPYGRHRCEAGEHFSRHRHVNGYMCMILSGGFTEAGDAGRFRARAGDVLIHGPYEAHLNLLNMATTDVLNLPIVAGLPLEGMVRIADVDAIARLAERSSFAAAEAIAASYQEGRSETDWPDLLATELRSGCTILLNEWARRHGLAPSIVSRDFRRVYGTPPSRYRAEGRARRVWLAVSSTRRPLAELAFDFGFADQAHMTRSLTRLTGQPPGYWRQRQSGSTPRPTGA